MWYDVQSEPFELNLTKNHWNSIDEDQPTGLVFHTDTWKFQLVFSGEGFDPDSLKDYLSCATEPHEVTVHMSDHKGATSYKLRFGPDYCEEV